MSYKFSDSPPLHNFFLTSIVIFIWTMIYLPELGMLEFQGTENKRAEPAMRMLETGDFIIPTLSGDTYLSKPPLIYWLISLSYFTTGNHSEWASRFPSTLAILAFVLIIMSSKKSFIPIDGRFFISVIFLTTFGIASKGRECEIEALYTAINGISFWLWINYEDALPASWKTGLLIGIFLGLGLLSKGPLILLFFYLPVVIYLFKTKRNRELWSPGYIVLIISAVVIFMFWAVQVYQKIPVSADMEVSVGWFDQMISRLNISEFRLGRWAGEIGASILNALPWIILLPFMLFNRTTANLENLSKFRACLVGILVSFIIVSLMPDVRSRYSLPLAANFCILSGWFLINQPEEGLFFKILRKCNMVLAFFMVFAILLSVAIIHSGLVFKIISLFDMNYSQSIAPPGMKFLIIMTFAAAGVIFFYLLSAKWVAPRTKHILMSGSIVGLFFVSLAIYIPPFLKPFENKREFGRIVNESVPPNAIIYQYCPEEGVGYQPFSIYIRKPVKHIETEDEVFSSPADSYILMRENFYVRLLPFKKFTERQPIIIKTLVFKKNTYHLIKLK
ncbi:MAG: hypothetical protein A2X48_17885 [Lentisphaerae bacterium GWF2_49_21]|nr:MAG: hypothetical protein A2X48_17885 [Lentisphaerae bacterium GWF2_49_21]